MSRMQRLASLVLVALWLPATLHCELEGSGLFQPAAACVAAGDDCCYDPNCFTLENALFKESAHVVKVSAPHATTCAVCLTPALTPDTLFAEPILSAARHVPPPELGVAWQFLTRAAPPARAPALNT